MTVSFILPGLPPSRNKLYYTDPRSGGQEWNQAALQWKAEVRSHIPPFSLTSESSVVSVHMEFHYPFYAKSGAWLTRDSDNLIKIVIDTIAKKCGFNDCRVKKGSWDSVNDSGLFTKVVLKELELTDGMLKVKEAV